MRVVSKIKKRLGFGKNGKKNKKEKKKKEEEEVKKRLKSLGYLS